MLKRFCLIACILISMTLVGAYGQSYSPLYPPSSNQYFYAYCTYYGYLITYCDVTLGTNYYANSNAHFHDSSGHPYSSVSPSSGNTGSSGYLPVTLTTTIIGQEETVYVCGYTCNYYDYAVGYNLSWIFWINGTIFNLVGGNTTNHGDNTYNHWMMEDAAYDIYYTCSDYINAHSLSQCSVNDMALVFGGKFDINDNWTSPHLAHDTGRAVDVNGIPQANVTEVLQDCQNHNAVDWRQETNGSLHCRF